MTECTHCRKRYDDSVRFCPIDGFAAAPVAEPWVGRLLMGQFLLKSVCGHGATGTVYQAVQAGMERAVAVKVLRADLLKDPDIVRRFVREARAGAKLNHQNIATVHLVGQTDEGVPFIVMEYVEGLALASVLTIGKPLPLARITHIGTQIASALSEAHSQGIVHRDLKPENILLTERRGEADVVKVVDFGIAKMVAHAAPGEDPISRLGTVFGTPHYIAPEQASGQAVDGRADIYSLGCILYQMATGHVPFEGQAGLQVLLSQVRDPVPDARQLNPRLADALAELILRMLAKNPAGRPQTAEEVSRLLQIPPSGRPAEGRPISGRAPQPAPVEVEPEHAAFFGPDVRTPPPRSGRDPRRGPGSGNTRSRASGRRSGQGERSSRVDGHGPDQDAAPRRARLEASDERPRHNEPAERPDRAERTDRTFREERTERVRTRAAHHRAAQDDSQDVPVPFLRRYWLPLLGVGGAVTFGLVAGLLYAQWASHPQVAPPPPAPTLLALPQPVPSGRSGSAGRSAMPLVRPAVAPTGAKPSSPRLPEVVFPAAPTLTGPHIVQPPTLVPGLPASTLAAPLPTMAPLQPTPPVLAPAPTVSSPAASAPAVVPPPVVTPPPVAPTPTPAAETPVPASSGAASAPPSAPAEKPAPEKPAPEKPPAAEKPAPADKPAPPPEEPEEPSSDPYHRLK